MLDRSSIRRVLEDLLRAEFTTMRLAGIGSLPDGPWPEEMPIQHPGLGADSLELLTLATAVNAMFHIHETGIEDLLLARRTVGAWVELIQQASSVGGRHITFLTSGSMGKAKRCTHAVADLVAEAMDHCERLRPLRILSAVPVHHIYGFLFSVLLPLHAGCEVIDIRHRLPDFRKGDVIVSFPDHWRYLAGSLRALPAVTGVSSTAPMQADLALDLTSRGLARLVEIYGSTETGGVGWRDRAGDPFTLLDRWTVAAAPRREGPLLLKGSGGSQVATPDAVVMAGPRAFHVQRRLDGAVQVGGINVFPAHVAAVLERHPLLVHAQVRLSAESGGRLKALVVPKDRHQDPDNLRQMLEAWSMDHLSTAELPRSFTIADRLPVGAMGKACDWTEAA